MNIIDYFIINTKLQPVSSKAFQNCIQDSFGGDFEIALDADGRYKKKTFALSRSKILIAALDRGFSFLFNEKSGKLLVFIVLSGEVRFSTDAEAMTCRRGDAVALDSGSARRAEFGAGTQLCALAFDAADAHRMTERLAGQTGHEHLAIAAPFRSDSAMGRTLAALVIAAVSSLAGETPPTNAYHSGELLQDGMIALLLENLPQGHSAVIASGPLATAPWAIRKAIAYIAANARQDVGVGDVAAAAGTSLRSLQQGFRRFLQASPQDYIRTVKLQGVRRELLETGSGRSIEEIARDWGFLNRGHFATEYRKLHGELPSQTRLLRKR